jgi:hypothetical protein
MLDQETLRSLVHYDPETGIMIWLPKKGSDKYTKIWNKRHAGKPLATIDGTGYIKTCIGKERKQYLVHRLIWLYVFGEFPEGHHIDHKNRNRSDNRLDNLRLTNPVLNKHNTETPANNTSGIKGVCKCKQTGKWTAQIYKSSKHIHLGRFDDIEDAKSAYVTASIKYAKEFSIYYENQ